MLYGFSCGNFCYDDRRIFYRGIRIQIFRRLQPDMAHDYVPCRRVYEKIQYRREDEKITALLLYLSAVVCNYLINLFLKKPMKGIFSDGLVQYLSYTSPFVVLSAVFLFIFFSKLNFGKQTEKIINYITPAALGVYLIHTHPLVFNKLIKILLCRL